MVYVSLCAYCLFACLYMCVGVYMYMCVRRRVYIYIHIYVCWYRWINSSKRTWNERDFHFPREVFLRAHTMRWTSRRRHTSRRRDTRHAEETHVTPKRQTSRRRDARHAKDTRHAKETDARHGDAMDITLTPPASCHDARSTNP